MKSALETTHELTKLVITTRGYFQGSKSEMAPGSPGVRVLCPTRWTVRAEHHSKLLCPSGAMGPSSGDNS